jgi:predicted GIY-YIG superfamily endonuclease
MAWVYILLTDNRQYYIGSTVDLGKRFSHHVHGHTTTTKRLSVERLVLKQRYQTLRDARSVEKKLKGLKRRDYIEKMIKDGYIRVQP